MKYLNKFNINPSISLNFTILIKKNHNVQLHVIKIKQNLLFYFIVHFFDTLKKTFVF